MFLDDKLFETFENTLAAFPQNKVFKDEELFHNFLIKLGSNHYKDCKEYFLEKLAARELHPHQLLEKTDLFYDLFLTKLSKSKNPMYTQAHEFLKTKELSFSTVTHMLMQDRGNI